MARAEQQDAIPKQKQRKRTRPDLEHVNEQAADNGDNKLTRALGSPDFTTREKGLQILTRWLTHRPNVSDADLNKIWKGLFYSFWHSDKQPVQEALAERLAQILPQLVNEVAFAYFRAFFNTMRREWFGIDRLRLDKFMMLVRKFVQQTFVHLGNLGWDSAQVETYTGFLTEQVLLKQDGQPALGLVYHLADCYVPELLAGETLQSFPAAAVPQLLAPFAELLARMQQQAGINRVLAGTFKPLLEAAAGSGDDASAGPFAEADVLSSLAASYFELGASPGVKAKNREGLYELSRRLEKAAAAAAAARSSGAPKPSKAKTAAAKAATAADSVTAAKAAVSPPVADSPAAAASSKAAKSGKKAKAMRSRLAQSSTAEDVSVPAQSPAAEDLAVLADSLPSVVAEAAAADGATPTSGKKKKRRKVEGDSAAASPAQAADASAQQISTPVTRSSAVSGTLQQNGAREAATPSTPASDQKRGVHFRLKKNLYFTHGGPPPPPDVRTPPSAKPKGPALRKTPATDPVKTAVASTPLNGKRKSAAKSPRSIPRSKAASFF